MYNKKNHIHFIGIGGIGMSAIATILKQQGYHVSGCDGNINQKSVHNLIALGCPVYAGNNAPECHDSSITAVVYSSGVPLDHPELIHARAYGIPVLHRSEMLAELMRTKTSIAVTGAHGKTTTTSLISHMLLEAETDPTLVIGGHLKRINTNGRLGNGPFLVAEADESDRSLLNLPYSIGVITNIDLEHLDVYKDLDDIKATFKKFIEQAPFYGKVIVCIDDQPVRDVVANLPVIVQKRLITYGFSEDAMIRLTNATLASAHATATVHHNGELLGTFTLAMAGIHNLSNAAATIAVGNELGIPFTVMAQALGNFAGVDRRFTFRGTYKNAEIFDDYGHHPNEIAHVLAVAHKRKKNKLTVVFQPHRYTRMHGLWQDFVNVFKAKMYDQLIITDIYGAGEQRIETITSQRLAQEIQFHSQNTVYYVPTDQHFTALKEHLASQTEAGDLILFLGAGNITLLAQNLK